MDWFAIKWQQLICTDAAGHKPGSSSRTRLRLVRSGAFYRKRCPARGMEQGQAGIAGLPFAFLWARYPGKGRAFSRREPPDSGSVLVFSCCVGFYFGVKLLDFDNGRELLNE